MKIFPKPLTHAEERECLKLCKEGSKDARDMLIEKNLRLVAHITKKYQHSGYDVEDLISVGTIGLIKAVDTFSQDKGSKLATYAAKCVENEILMLLRMNKKISREVSLFEPIGVDKDGETVSLVDVVEMDTNDAVDNLIHEQNIEELYAAYSKVLNDIEKNVISMRYGLFAGKEYTQREIAGKLGISRSYVSRIEKKAIEKIRKEFIYHSC